MKTKPRKPTALRRLTGNAGHRPLNEREPRPLRMDMPQPPSWLEPKALEQWHRVVPELHAMGVIAVIDETVIGAYCQLFARWRAAEDAIRETAAADAVSKGLLMRMPSGAIVQSPLVGIANAALKNMLRAGAEIGLSPSSRAHLAVDPPLGAERDLMEKYSLSNEAGHA